MIGNADPRIRRPLNRAGAWRFFLVLLALYPGCLLAQEVAFTYVAPAADIDAQFGAGGVTGGDIPAGYKGIDLTDGNEATFTSNAPPRILHLYQQLQAGTTLRDRIDEVMQISGGRVDVTYFLVDDRTGLSGDTGAMTPFTHNSQTHVWPAASVSPRGDVSGRYDGKIGMGETAGDVIATNLAGGILAWEGTALHETSHTQFVGPWTKWGAINQRAITYGEDGDHYSEELLGDQAAALDEGHGTFYGNLHNAAERRETIDFFTRDDHRYFVEARSVLAGSEPLYTVEERRSGTVGGTDVWEYKWEDVPGFYLLFSESTATAFYVFFWQHVNGDQDQAFEMITASSRDMWEDRLKRFLTFACNRLALQLEEYAASTEGQAARTAGTLTSSMFPFALLDILTHFGMSEEQYRADYRRRYPDREPRAFEAYWGHREAVQRLVEDHLSAAPIRIEEAVEAAHDYFRSSDRILTAEGGGDASESTTAETGTDATVSTATAAGGVPRGRGVIVMGQPASLTTESIVARFRDHGVSWVAFSTFNRRTEPSIARLRPLAQALRAWDDDFQIYVWELISSPSTSAEYARRLIDVAAGIGATGVIGDPEGPAWHGEEERMRGLVTALRAGTEEHRLSVGMTSIGVLSDRFPMEEFRTADFVMPQVYDRCDHLHGDLVRPGGVRPNYAEDAVALWQRRTGRPVIPLSGAHHRPITVCVPDGDASDRARSKTAAEMRNLLSRTPIPNGAIGWWQWLNLESGRRWNVVEETGLDG